jgi:uncharacterized protein
VSDAHEAARRQSTPPPLPTRPLAPDRSWRRAFKQRGGPHGKRQLTSVEPEVLAELRGLRARVPHLMGGLVASTDGMVIAHDAGELEPQSVAALAAASLAVGSQMTEATGQGGFRELLARGEHGYVATYAAGTSMILTVLAGPATNVGRLHLEARRSSGRIAGLADA